MCSLTAAPAVKIKAITAKAVNAISSIFAKSLSFVMVVLVCLHNVTKRAFLIF